MATTTKPEDFGEKIGGARKDLWKKRGLDITDLLEMSDYEKKQYVNKNNIWKKPDYEAMLQDGISKEAIYFIKLVRDSLPPKFLCPRYMDIEEGYSIYISFISEIRDVVQKCKTLDDIKNITHYLYDNGYISEAGTRRVRVKESHDHLIDKKFINAFCNYIVNLRNHQWDINRKQFLFTDKEKYLTKFNLVIYEPNTMKFTKADRLTDYECLEIYQSSYLGYSKTFKYIKQDAAQLIKDNIKEGSTLVFYGSNFLLMADSKEEAINKLMERKERNSQQTQPKTKQKKEKYIPPQLKGIERMGQTWRSNNHQINTDDMLNIFHFRGGEFGNWLNESDRKQSLNFCYDALRDLSSALGIQATDISFGNTLAIAFGARGISSAAAHYEPGSMVINLTKMKGAGSLGHEWIHALDHAVAVNIGGYSADLATRAPYSIRKDIPQEFWDVMRAINKSTNFINAANELDKKYSKTDNGYWSSPPELLARAGACWLHDKLQSAGIKNDYLCGHCEGALIAPHGEERITINQAFDAFLDKAKEIGLFHEEYMLPVREQNMIVNLAIDAAIDENIREYNPDVYYENVSIFDLLEQEEDIDI